MRIVLLATLGFFCTRAGAQIDSMAVLKETLVTNISTNTCHCIDSISISNKSKEDIVDEVRACIDESMMAYQLAMKLVEANTNADGAKEISVDVDPDKNSKTYKAYYYDMERLLMENCPSLKAKLAAQNEISEFSYSRNKKAQDLYNKGVKASQAGDNKKAASLYKKAVDEDPKFVFAWDNLGLCYRKMGEYDKALDAYKSSLAINPNGQMPLQNIAIVYSYKKEYTLAIEAYQNLARVDPDNPEIFYGIGLIYANYLDEPVKALDNMCTAYNLYIKNNSPYRTDAETVIQQLFAKMKERGKEKEFFDILEKHQIHANDQ